MGKDMLDLEVAIWWRNTVVEAFLKQKLKQSQSLLQMWKPGNTSGCKSTNYTSNKYAYTALPLCWQEIGKYIIKKPGLPKLSAV